MDILFTVLVTDRLKDLFSTMVLCTVQIRSSMLLKPIHIDQQEPLDSNSTILWPVHQLVLSKTFDLDLLTE